MAKFKLSELKVDSFVTKLTEGENETYKAGRPPFKPAEKHATDTWINCRTLSYPCINTCQCEYTK